MEDEELIWAFENALHEFAGRLGGGVSVLAAAAACQSTFGPLQQMTLWQRREVNRVLAEYGVALDFPDPGPLRAV